MPLAQTDVVEWAIEATGSRPYVQGFDAGYHGFAPLEQPPHDYTLGRADGELTRLLVEQPNACRPAIWCWRGGEENE